MAAWRHYSIPPLLLFPLLLKGIIHKWRHTLLSFFWPPAPTFLGSKPGPYANQNFWFKRAYLTWKTFCHFLLFWSKIWNRMLFFFICHFSDKTKQFKWYDFFPIEKTCWARISIYQILQKCWGLKIASVLAFLALLW